MTPKIRNTPEPTGKHYKFIRFCEYCKKPCKSEYRNLISGDRTRGTQRMLITVFACNSNCASFAIFKKARNIPKIK
jgi:hypothetical protein